MHSMLALLCSLEASAGTTLQERLKTLSSVAEAAEGAPVDDRLGVLVVEGARVSLGTDSLDTAALFEEEFPVATGGPGALQRVTASGLTPRLKAAARGGAQRINVVVDAHARADLLMALLQTVGEAGLTAQLVDVKTRPWKRWFTVGLQECHEGSVKDCVGDPDGCEPRQCAQLSYALSGKGALLAATRRLMDGHGACLEKPGDATPLAPAPWDGIWLKGDKDACPAIGKINVDTLKAAQARVASHIVPCEAVNLQLRPDDTMDRVGALLNALSVTGASVVTFEAAGASGCESAQPMDALDAKVVVETERVSGALKINAVAGVLRSQRTALSQCLTRVRMKDPGVHGVHKAALKVLDNGSVLSVKWDNAPPEALKTCFDRVLKAAAFDRAAKSTDVKLSLTSEP